jgi:hypothetical protein
MAAKGLEEADLMADPFAMISRFAAAVPLPYRSDSPEQAEADVKTFDATPSMIVLSKTFDPEWWARWTNEEGQSRPATVVKVLGGWQGVAIPEPGRWTLRLEYPGQAVWLGLTVGSTAWSVWLMGYLASWSRKRPRQVAASPTEPEAEA